MIERSGRPVRRWVAAALSVAATLATSGVQAARYHLVDLGLGSADAVNDVGIIAGNQLGEVQPMRWQKGRWRNLPQNEGTFGSGAYAIDHHGDISGYLETADDQHYVPVMWRIHHKGYTLLELPPGTTDGIATAITNDGRAAGYEFGGTCLTWDSKGTVTDIGRPAGEGDCTVTGMNVWGELTVLASSYHGYVWRLGHFHAIGTLGDPVSEPLAINRYGQVVGMSVTAAGGAQPFTWRNGRMTELPTPDASYVYNFAAAISDTGVIVGYGFSNDDASQHALMWDADGSVSVLNTLVDNLGEMNLEYAYGVGNDGTIVGLGLLPPYEEHAFMLVPLP